MLSSGVIDVVIGLAFIYLLYSLLATAVQEGIAATGQMRAKMLRRAIKQMLTNTDYNLSTVVAYYAEGLYALAYYLPRLPRRISWLLIYTRRTWYKNRKKTVSPPFTGSWLLDGYTWFRKITLQLFPERPETALEFWERFYQHPLIKNYGEDRGSPLPSYIPSSSFSSVLIDILKKDSGSALPAGFKAFLKSANNIPSDTIDILLLLLDGAEQNAWKKLRSLPAGTPEGGPTQPTDEDVMIEFKIELEQWFNDSMVRVTGWYKRKAQLYLFAIGCLLAIGFNIDSLEIANKLSKDKDARKQLTDLAAAYINSHDPPENTDTLNTAGSNKKVDSLVAYAQDLLHKDIANANTLLAIGYSGYGEDDDTFVQKKLMAIPDYKRIIQRDQLEAKGKIAREIRSLRIYSDSIRVLGGLIADPAKKKVFTATPAKDTTVQTSRRLTTYRTALLEKQKPLSDSIAIFDSVAGPLANTKNGYMATEIKQRLKEHGGGKIEPLLDQYLSSTTAPEERIRLDSVLRAELKEKKLELTFDSLVLLRESYIALERARMSRRFNLNNKLLEVIARFNLVNADTTTEATERADARRQIYALSDSLKLVADYKNSNLPAISLRMAVNKFYSGENCWLFGIKVRYVMYLISNNNQKLIGFLITALALTLGAPFWFDLLNKFMQLRGSVKQGDDKKQNT